MQHATVHHSLNPTFDIYNHNKSFFPHSQDSDLPTIVMDSSPDHPMLPQAGSKRHLNTDEVEDLTDNNNSNVLVSHWFSFLVINY